MNKTLIIHICFLASLTSTLPPIKLCFVILKGFFIPMFKTILIPLVNQFQKSNNHMIKIITEAAPFSVLIDVIVMFFHCCDHTQQAAT